MFGSWAVGLLVAVAEFFMWLQTAKWPQWFTDPVLLYGPNDLTQWLLFPYSWLGLHKIVMSIVGLPLSVAIAFLGTIIGAVTMLTDR